MSFLHVILRPNAPFIYIYFTTEALRLKKKKKQRGTFCAISCKRFCSVRLCESLIDFLFSVSPASHNNAFVKHWIVTLSPISQEQRAIYWSHQLSLVTLLRWNAKLPSTALGPVTLVRVPPSPFPPLDRSLHPPRQSSLRTPSFRGPLVALRSARFASSSFLLSSRFFLDSSALLRPGWQWRRAVQCTGIRWDS